MRFSLREILVLTTACAVAMPLLCFANSYTRGATIAATALVGSVMVVQALVNRGRAQAAALGFVAVAGLYASTVVFISDRTDLNPSSSRFPTVQILKQPLMWIQQQRSSDAAAPLVFGVSRSSPKVGDFVPIAHCLWTLLHGYVGAKYALYVYHRREQAAQDKEAKT